MGRRFRCGSDGGGVDSDGDLAAHCLGVRADLVGGVGEFGGGGLVDAADFEVEDRGEGVAVAAVVEGDLGVYPGAGEPDLAFGGGDAGGAEEAGSPVGGEELLGVGRVAGAAELLGEGQGGLQQAVTGLDVAAVAAFAGDVDDGGVAVRQDLSSSGGRAVRGDPSARRGSLPIQGVTRCWHPGYHLSRR